MKKISVVILMLAFVACSTKIYTPTSANVDKKETATLAELQQGHDLFKDKCGRCHKLPKPESRNSEQWTKVLEKMGPKAKLSKEQISLVHKYVANF